MGGCFPFQGWVGGFKGGIHVLIFFHIFIKNYNVRSIFLPELLNIQITNYTLYPNGLNFTYEFVKGFNLVIGGNGMGKTTFVSLIKYGIIGNYKKQYDYGRTYKENKIEKRLRNQDSFFKNRIDNSITTDTDPEITISFKIADTIFTVKRGIKDILIKNIYIDGIELEGDSISEEKYELEKHKKEDVTNYLPYKYEKAIEEVAGLTFDDLIFFVNYILFFGEDHKTVLWNEEVQKDLFNKFFNTPEWDEKRKEAEREAKYFDSKARHKSEDIRAIKKVLDRIEETKNDKEENPLKNINSLKEEIENLDKNLSLIHNKRKSFDNQMAINQGDINKLSMIINDIETEKNTLENKLSFSIYKSHHKLYDTFQNSIKSNHICPLCNSKSEELYERTVSHSDNCWVCNNKITNSIELDKESQEKLKSINQQFSKNTILLKNKQAELKQAERLINDLDKEFRNLESHKRFLLKDLREYEFQNSAQTHNNELQAFYDEIQKLTVEKDDFTIRSNQKFEEANEIAKLIENTIIDNVKNFSNLFSMYAEKFLGVNCFLTFDKMGKDDLKKFYPVINNTLRESEEELSESQRFFVDHSFRMSILTHFYSTPSFYIVETPDSSLDISYEKNAADVFLSFLQNPYNLILTSNLNNSAFIDYIIENKNNIEVSIIPLYEIAKKTNIQQSNEMLKKLYEKLKKNNG